MANLHESDNNGNNGELGLLASLPQAPIPQHEFAGLSDCYMEHHQPQNEAASPKDQMGQVYSPEYISL